MKKVLLITTGGTIVSETTDAGLTPLLEANSLLRFVPELTERYQIDVVPVMNIESPDLLPCQWQEMVAPIEAHYEEYDGFVIVHGTDTLAYTASALNYLVQNSRKPIVVTGSQYPIEANITDGKKNLRDSCIFAAESGMGGVYVVFSSHVIKGARVKKVRTKDFAAFGSVNFPEPAKVADGRILHYIRPEEPEGPVKFYHEMDDSVFLMKLYPGIRPEDFDFVADRYKALYIESYGVGGLAANIIPYIEKWKQKGLTVVIGTQALEDGTDLEIYTVGFALSTKLHCLQSYDMTSEAVMTKLMYVLGRTRDPEEISRLFLERVGDDVLVP